MERRRFILNGRNEYDGSPAYFCFDFDVKYNRRGNIEVEVDKIPSYFIPFFSSKKYVFNKYGVCVSHLPSEKYKYHKFNAELVKLLS